MEDYALVECKEIKITVVSDLTCPTCGSGEMHPNGENILIRGFKVHHGGHWWSQCLVCSGYYDKDLVPQPDKWDRDKGWF